MTHVESHKGFDIFSEKKDGDVLFHVCLDTPDGLMRSNTPFNSIESAKESIDKKGSS